MPIDLQIKGTADFTQPLAQVENLKRALSSKDFSQPLGRISGDAAEFRKSLEAATARVTAFGLTAGAIYKVSEAIRAGAKATIEVDKQLVELNTFLGQSKDQLEGFSRSLFKVARNAAVPFEAATEAAKEFARQGLSTNEVLKRTEDALTLARISGINYGDAVNGITTAINSFNKEALSSTEIVNKLIAVDSRFAVSSAQLNEALTRVGSSAEESGISIDKLIATVTAAQQITGRGGAVIGNALKTIFTRLQRPEVLTQLQQLGVSIKDQNGFLLDGISILKNYADATKNLSQIEKSRTAELIGGIYQINQVNALIKDLSSSNSVYAEALRTSSSAIDEAKRKNEELNKSMSALLQTTKTQAQEAAAVLGKSMLEPMVRIGSDFTKEILKLVNPESSLLQDAEKGGESIGTSFVKGAASALGKTLAVGGIPLAVGVGGTLLTKMAKFGVNSVRNISKDYQSIFSEKTLLAQERVNDLLKQNPSLISAVQNKTMSLAAAEKLLLNTIKEQNKELATQAAIRARVVPAVIARGGPRKIRADGYIPNFSGSDAEEEVYTAKNLGAKNPRPRVIQATIKGKTGPVMVNSEEKIIPNFAGTGETAIIPNYRNIQDIPGAASGYVPNFANQDREILRSIIGINRTNMSTDRFANPRKYNMKTPLYRGVSATSERWRSIDRNDPEAVKKAVFSQVDYAKLIPGYDPKKAFMGSYFEDLMSSHRITPLNQRDIWDEMHRNTRHFGYSRSLPILSTSKDPSIAYQFSGNSGASSSMVINNSRILGKESLYKGLYDKYGEDKVREVMFRQSKAGGGRGLGLDFNSLSKSNAFNYEHEVGLFAGGHIPNFAQIKDYPSDRKIIARFRKGIEKGKYFSDFYDRYEKTNPLAGADRELFNKIYASQSYGTDDSIVFDAAVKIFKGVKSGEKNFGDVLKPLGLYKGRGKILDKILSGKELSSEKTGKYFKALSGDKNALAIDRNVINTALGRTLQKGEATSAEFRERLRKLIRKEASHSGMDPRAIQAALFAGRSPRQASFDAFDKGFSQLKSGGYIPNFAGGSSRIVGEGSNLFVSSLYDTLSGEFGGGPEYPFVRPGKAAAFLNESKTKDFTKLITPTIQSGGRVIFGAQAGSVGGDLGLIKGLAGNRIVVDHLKKVYPKLASRFIQEGSSTEDLTGLFKKFYRTLGPNKMREIVAPFIEPDILSFYKKNKNFGASISRLAELGPESLNPTASEHSLYPAAIAGRGLSRINPVNAQQLFTQGGNLNTDQIKKLFGTLRIAKLPIGIRWNKGDATAKMLGLSGGYIPNFAGLSDAVSREKMMSGLPASQIMAHFDGRGNPVAVTNRRDEPGGLRDVPNFAKVPSGLIKSAGKFFNKLIGGGSKTAPANPENPISGAFELFFAQSFTQIFDELAERGVVPAGVAEKAAYAVPIGVGAKNIGKAFLGKGLSKGGRILTGLTGAAQAIGGGYLASKTTGGLSQRIDEKKMSEEIDRAKRSFQNLTENTTELATTLSKLDAAYKDPKADPKEISKLVKNREDILKKITIKNPDLVSKLAGQESLAGKIDILEENQRESQRVLSLKETAAAFKAKGNISGAEAPEQLASFFEEAINRAKPDLFKQDFAGATPANFAEILKKGGLDVKEFSSIFNTDDLKKSFIASLKLAKELQAISFDQEQSIRKASRPLAIAQQRTADAREIRGEIQKVLAQQLPELASFAGGFSKRAGISAEAEGSLAIKKAEAAVGFQNSLLAQLNNKDFLKGLPSGVEDRLRNIESPGEATAKELQKLESLPGLSKEQVIGIQKLIDYNSQQTRDLTKAAAIAEETKKIQLKFLSLQEKLAFGGDIKASINSQMRAEAMNAGIRGPLTYQLGGMIGSRRSQIAGTTDFITDTLQRYPGLLTTKEGKEPGDITAVKNELTKLNAFDMQKDLLKRSRMAQMMGLGQTASLLQGKAFDQRYLLESAGLKANALFESPGVPKEVQEAMKDYEKFSVASVRASKEEDKYVRRTEEETASSRESVAEQARKSAKELSEKFEAALKSTFGEKGIEANIVNLNAKEVNPNNSVNAISEAYKGMGGLLPKVNNFANPFGAAIGDAVNREKTALAKRGIIGVPNFAVAGINLERSPNLMSSSNPMGFGITNTIDEKNGLRSLGMRSGGYVPNYALFGEKVAAAGLASAKAGNLFVYDNDAQGFYKVNSSGKVTSQFFEKDSLPKGAKTISTQPYGTKTITGQLKGSNILGIKDPRINKLDELKISTIPKSKRLDPILNKLSRAGKLTPENLLAEINKISGGNQTLVKTAFGESFAQGQGVFGRKGGVGLGDAGEIIKRFQSGEAKGFFTQAAVEGPHYGEMRIHVAVDSSGRVKLLKGGSILKIGSGATDITSKEGLDALSKSGLGKEAGKVAQEYKKAAQATAVKSIRELVAKKGIKNAFFGVDVGATTLESARKAGVNTKEFYSGGRGKVGTVVFELNPSESLGSSGYIRGSNTQKLVEQVLGKQIGIMPPGFAPKGTLTNKKAADISTSLLAKQSNVISTPKTSARTRDALGRFTSNSGISKNTLKLLKKYGGKTLTGLAVIGAGSEIGAGLNQIINEDQKLIGAGNISSGVGSLAMVGAGLAGAGIATTLALPAAVAALGYGTIKGVEKTGLFEAAFGAGAKEQGLAAIAGRKVRGLTGKEAYESDQIVARKMELVKEINKYNSASGYPLVSKEQQISKSRVAQEAKIDQDIEALKGNLDKESAANRAAMDARINKKVEAYVAGLDKESQAANEAQSSKLRKGFLESFDKNAESAGFSTSLDRARYIVSQENQNGLGRFKSTEFADSDFARTVEAARKEKEAANLAQVNRPISVSDMEFLKASTPQFSKEILEQAARAGVSAETLMADRAAAATRSGAVSQGMTMPEINAQMAREEGGFPKDVLEEAARRRVTAEQVMQERGGKVPNFAAMSNGMMSSGDVYSRMRSTSPRSMASGYSGGYVPNFAAGDFTNAITEALRSGITSAFPNGPSSSSVSNSNVINIDGRTSIQNAPDEAMQGIIGILFDKIPELKKLGPTALNFKR